MKDGWKEQVRKARRGDQQAFEFVVSRYKDLVFTLIRRLVSDPETATDLSQETFIKVYLKFRTLKDCNRFPAWLCSIARRTALDYLRKRKPEFNLSDEILNTLPGGEDPAGMLGDGIIETAIEKLGPRDRTLLTLAYYKDLKLSEVSKIMEIPEKNIRVYLHRARKRLREHLRGYEDELLQKIG